MWTSEWSLDRWRENHEVLIIDNTYKTNRFNLPFMQIAGVTGSHTSFSVGWAVMLNETESGFRWTLNQLKEMVEQHHIDVPFVIITDKDETIRNVIHSLFEGDLTATQLCLWHVQKNVAFNIKTKWNGMLDGTALGHTVGGVGSRTAREREEKEERQSNRIGEALLNDRDRHTRAGGEDIHAIASQHRGGRMIPNAGNSRVYEDSADGILAAWKSCVYSEQREMFYEQWDLLKREFPNQQPIIQYLGNVYIPVNDQFAEWSTRQHRNYGIRVTSRVEGLHELLKSELKSRNASLWDLFQANVRFLRRQMENWNRARQDDRIKMPNRAERNFLFSMTLRRVSVKAIEILQDQEAKANDAINNRRTSDRCEELFSGQYGLPCWHKLLENIEAKKPIEMSEIHVHWYNTRIHDPVEKMRRRRQDPAIRPRRVGDQQGRRHDTSTTRIRSHDELTVRRQTATQQSTVISTQTLLEETPESERTEASGQDSSIQTSQVVAAPTPLTPAQTRPHKCGACGREGHRRTSYLCPLKRI